jgi:hypothetical protein
MKPRPVSAPTGALTSRLWRNASAGVLDSSLGFRLDALERPASLFRTVDEGRDVKNACLAVPLFCLLLLTSGCVQSNAKPAVEPSAEPTGRAEIGVFGVPAGLADFPQVPQRNAKPWAPMELERKLGATCVDRDQNHHGSPTLLMPDEYCRGPAPRHMARAWMAIPADVLASTQQERARALHDAVYLAASGYGARPDFTVVVGESFIRSFESPDPAKMVYLVWPVKCNEGDASMECRAGGGRKAFRLDANGRAHDVSAQVLPPDPVLDAADLARQQAHGGSDLALIDDKLPYAPTMRWLMEFDPDQPLASDDPRRAEAYAHFGFVHWNGTRFELVQRIARSQWPCRQVPPGKHECSDFPDAGEDPFVTR